MKKVLCLVAVALCLGLLSAQPWVADNAIFNPSGIPSLTFSQPRFADIDADGDMDIMLGSSSAPPIYLKNIGTTTAPSYTVGENITAPITSLNAEMVSAIDLDADGDLDLVTGGYTGLHLYLNTGSNAAPLYTISPGYFQNVSTGNYPVPDLADYDADGDLDMVLGYSESGAVKLYTNTGSASSGVFSDANSSLLGDVGLYAYPVFCDYDSDGDQDVLCGRDVQGFIYYQNNGTPSEPLWETNGTAFTGVGSGTYWNSGDLADLDNDGDYELIYGTADGPLVYFVNQGTLTSPNWQMNDSLFGGVLDSGGASSPVFYDFDEDGDLDMISGSQLGDIKYFQNTGTIYAPAWVENSAYFSSIDHSIYSAVTLGTLDGDFLPDAIVGDLSGQIYFHRNTGFGFNEEAGPIPAVSVGGWSVPRLVDMDFDLDLDLVIGNEAGNLRYWENQGSPQAANFVEVTGYFGGIDVGSNCSPTFGDLDADGDMDMLAGTMWGDLKCYLRGPLGWTLDNTLFAGITTDQNAAPALVDLDHDGDLDFALGDYDGTFKFYRNQLYSAATLNPPQNIQATFGDLVTVTWDAPLPGSTSPFEGYHVYVDGVFNHGTNEQYVHLNLQHNISYQVDVTASYIAGESVPVTMDILIVPNSDAIEPPMSINTWPNPFSTSATIAVNVDKPDGANLEIYNIKGEKVRVWNTLRQGKQQLEWDGRDDNGRPVASGTYICRLRTNTGSAIRRMLFLRK
jgi:hypothetical protein